MYIYIYIYIYLCIYIYIYVYIYQNPSKFGQHICEKHKFQNTRVRWTQLKNTQGKIKSGRCQVRAIELNQIKSSTVSWNQETWSVFKRWDAFVCCFVLTLSHRSRSDLILVNWPIGFVVLKSQPNLVDTLSVRTAPFFFWSLHIAQCPACLNLLAYCWYEIISDGINSCSIFNIQIGTKMVVVLESEQVVKIARAQFCTFLQFPLSTFEHDVTN